MYCSPSQALEASFQRVTSEKQQLAFDYRDLQAVNAKLQTDIKMLKSGFAMTGGPEVRLLEVGVFVCMSCCLSCNSSCPRVIKF